MRKRAHRKRNEGLQPAWMESGTEYAYPPRWLQLDVMLQLPMDKAFLLDVRHVRSVVLLKAIAIMKNELNAAIRKHFFAHARPGRILAFKAPETFNITGKGRTGFIFLVIHPANIFQVQLSCTPAE